jgi:polysaccharide biosynthesis protein PslH
MKVLFLSPYPPYPPNFGGSTRIFNLMRQVASRHEVISLSYESTLEGKADLSGLHAVADQVVCIKRPPEKKRWNQAKSLVSSRTFQRMTHYSRAMQEAIDTLVAREKVEMIVVEFSQMAVFDFPAEPAIIIDQHNVESDLIYRSCLASPPSFRKLYQFVESKKFGREERLLLGKADVVTVTSDCDGKKLAENDPDLDIEVVPNGVDIDFFVPHDSPGEPNTLVFTGAIHYHPNFQGATWFLDNIFPLIQRDIEDVRFIAAGGTPPAELTDRQTNNIIFTGYVDDIREYVAKASVFVVPLLVGGGTRFKVLEAMASGKPVVSTSLGSEGIPVKHGEDVLLADDPESFAAAVVELLKNRRKAERLTAAGRVFVEKNFAWNVIGARFERALERAATGKIKA